MPTLSQFYSEPVTSGTTAGTYAAGDDARIVNAVQAVGQDDIEITVAGKGLVLKSDNGKRWKITMTDNGLQYIELEP